MSLPSFQLPLDRYLTNRLRQLDFTNPVALDLNHPKALQFNLKPDEQILVIFPQHLKLCREGLLSSAERVIESARRCQDPESVVAEALASFIQAKSGAAFNFGETPHARQNLNGTNPINQLQVSTFPQLSSGTNYSSEGISLFSAWLPELTIGSKDTITDPQRIFTKTTPLPEIPNFTREQRQQRLASQTLNWRRENGIKPNRRRSKLNFLKKLI